MNQRDNVADQLKELLNMYEFSMDTLSKPSCPTFGTTINETVQAIGY